MRVGVGVWVGVLVAVGVWVAVGVLVDVGEGPGVLVKVGVLVVAGGGLPSEISHTFPSFSLGSAPLSTPRLQR